MSVLQGEFKQPNWVLTMSKEKGCGGGFDGALTCPPKKLCNSLSGQTFSIHNWTEFLTTPVDEACNALKNRPIHSHQISRNPPLRGVSFKILARFFLQRFLACKGVLEVVLLFHASKAFQGLCRGQIGQ